MFVDCLQLIQLHEKLAQGKLDTNDNYYSCKVNKLIIILTIYFRRRKYLFLSIFDVWPKCSQIINLDT